MERVATVEVNGDAVAYPFSKLSQVHVVNDTVGGAPLVVLHQGGTVSALDGPTIAASREIGAATVFDRQPDETCSASRYTTTASLMTRPAQPGTSWGVPPLARSRVRACVQS